MTDLWKLPGIHLFADLEPGEREKVLRIVATEHFEPGEFLFTPSDAGDRLYLLQQGRVKTFVLSELGQEKIMHIFHPGDAFGSLLHGASERDIPWAQAIDDVTVSSMDEAAFKRFMQACPDLCMRIFRYMTAHHVADMRRMESLIHTRASHRLVLTLLDLGDRLGCSEAEEFELDPCFTHEDLANMIGVVRSTVSELIGELRREGVLSGQGRRLIVHRQAAERFLLTGEAVSFDERL